MHYGIDATPPILDKIKEFGYKYVTESGITWGIDNVKVPKEKKELVARGRKEEEETLSQYNEGLLSEDEKYRKNIEIWDRVKSQIEKAMPSSLEKNGSAYDILMSKSRGSVAQLTQMAGMKGLIVNPSGRTIDFPIIPSYKEGLSPIEYFIITH